MADHYELLGVARGASREELRTAYRARREELAGAADRREQLAALNQAWNVLADPYQRGRYDAELDAAATTAAPSDRPGATDDVVGVDDAADDGAAGGDASEAAGAAGARSRPERPRPPRPEPTVDIPAGMCLAETRPRVMAMLLDLTVLLLVVFGAQTIAGQVVESRFPDELDELERLGDEIDDLDDERDELGDRIDEVEGAITAADADAAAADEAGDDDALREARAARADLQDELAELEDEDAELRARRDELTDEVVDIQGDLLPVQLGFFAGALGVALLYLVPSTAISGQTLGKRLRGVRVVRLDGRPPGWTAAFLRFAPLVAFVGAFLFVLGQLAVVLGLVAVLLWLRNPNRQGLHDRLARTLVVEGPALGRRRTAIAPELDS